jgi:hypothetical protein
MISLTKRHFNVWAGGLVLIAAALLYTFTLDNGLRSDELTGGDLITHQYAQVEARPSNAPGYPLYTMGGWLWFRLARAGLGRLLNPTQMLSLYSTLWGLAALLLLYVILLNVTNGMGFIAAPLTTFYATTFFFWYYTVTTEQYTSAIVQTLLVIWLALRWDEHPRDSTLRWLAVIVGTMLANMVTTLFIVPPLLWFILARRDRVDGRLELRLARYLKQPKLIGQLVGLALLPLLSYAYIYIRGAQHPEWRGLGTWSSTGAWFVQFLTIQQGRNELAPGLTLHNLVTAEFPSLMWQELTWPIFFGGLIGLTFLGRRRAVFLYSTLVICFIFSWAYRFGNWFQVIIPAYPIFIMGTAVGLYVVSQRVFEGAGVRNQELGIRGRGLRSGGQVIIVVLISSLVVYRLATNFPQANQRNQPEDTGLDPGWAILADAPVPPAVVSADFGEQVALEYLSAVWGVARHIYPTTAGDFELPPGVAHNDHRTYISRRAIAAAPQAIQPGSMVLEAAGEQLIAIRPAPREKLPAQAIPLDTNFGDNLRLVGWEQIEPQGAVPEDVGSRLNRANWQIALYWRADAPLAEDYTISVRPLVGGQLITQNGETIIQDHQPVWGAYPTSHWRAGELVRDVYALSLPEGVSSEAVQIVVYRTTETGFENLAEQTIGLGSK